MKVTKNVEEARKFLADAIESMEEQETKIQALPDDVSDEERDFHKALFDTRTDDVARARETLERLLALQEARKTVPPDSEDEQEAAADAEKRGGPARPRGSSNEPLTYRLTGPFSFFRDLYYGQIGGDPEAQARLAQNNREMQVEERTMSTTVTAGGNFIPPQYLGNIYAELPRPGRPFADAVPKSPLMATGMSITVPRITTGTLVATQTTQNTSLGTQDIVEALLTVPIVTIGGYADLSVQLAERADPSFDQVLFNDLRADYDRLLDSQLINGTGTTQHVGIRSVASIQTSTYSTATPTAAGLYPKIYDGIQKVSTNRYMEPDMALIHPRRSAWFASNLSSTFTLFPQPNLVQAAGTQAGGYIAGWAGLQWINDPNIGTTYSVGGSTNEDEIYILRSSDMILYEGSPRVEVFRDVGSATGTVRVRLYAFSAFASGRYPSGICKIAGSGLSTPSF